MKACHSKSTAVGGEELHVGKKMKQDAIGANAARRRRLRRVAGCVSFLILAGVSGSGFLEDVRKKEQETEKARIDAKEKAAREAKEKALVAAENARKQAAEAFREFQRKREEWIAKETSPDVKAAVEHMKTADLKHPVLEDAVMAARCADVNALLTIHKNTAFNSPIPKQSPADLKNNSFDWKNPEIMLAASKTPFLVNVKTVHGLGGNVNAKYENGVTPLMCASLRGHVEVVKYLIEHGADVNAIAGKKAAPASHGRNLPPDGLYTVKAGDNFGKIAKRFGLKVADIIAANPGVDSSRLKTGQKLRLPASAAVSKQEKEAQENVTALMAASNTPNNLETVKYLVEHGADVNAKTKDGWTALMIASKYANNLETVKYLIEKGSDVNAKKTKDGWTALMIASTTPDNLETVKYLVEHGADVNVKALKTYVTALLIAAYAKQFETVKFLVEHGADVNAMIMDGKTALMLLASRTPNDLSLMKLLVEHGADVNVKDKNGWTALIWASYHGNFETVKYLVSKGADVNAKDMYGWTALMLASRIPDSLGTVKYLVEHGAEVNAKMKDDWTALDFAKEEKHQDVVDYLRSKGASSGRSWFSW